MAELPEISKFSKQMNDTLKGKKIKEATLLQEKCSNMTEQDLQNRLYGKSIESVSHKGKWIIFHLDHHENILLSLGMGGDTLYFTAEQTLPEKYQIKILFIDHTGFTIRFWWFGKFFILNDAELEQDTNTKDIAIDPFNPAFTYDHFRALFKGRKSQLKSFLMNQKNIGGIGNMYMHDILFKSGLHPQKKISDMTETEFQQLYNSIIKILRLSESKGAFDYEIDFFGKKGGYTTDDFLIAYKEKQPCPVCGSTIEQIKTGSTSSYICPVCQPLA